MVSHVSQLSTTIWSSLDGYQSPLSCHLTLTPGVRSKPQECFLSKTEQLCLSDVYLCPTGGRWEMFLQVEAMCWGQSSLMKSDLFPFTGTWGRNCLYLNKAPEFGNFVLSSTQSPHEPTNTRDEFYLDTSKQDFLFQVPRQFSPVPSLLLQTDLSKWPTCLSAAINPRTTLWGGGLEQQ